MSALPPFNGNAYRKRVLAAVDARGGPEQSDPFEIYDLPLAEADTLPDAVVAAQIDAVWAFWQKQRDHPKYRGVVTAMLAIHRDIADQMRTRDGRRWLAEQTVAERARREEGRYAELDAALQRLVERFGGVPQDKVDGLRRFALAAGVDEGGFDTRLRRHRLVTVQRPQPAPADDVVLRQVRADLEELGQLDGATPAATLYALLGLPPGADRPRVRERRDALAARNRELRPDRRRALVDDLLAAVTALLLNDDPDRYLDSVRSDVLARLRPRVAAAVLVEDELTSDDHAHLLGEAQAAGLDRDRAVSVLAQLAAELGVPLRVGGHRSATTSARTRPTAAAAGLGWQRDLSLARAALRDGRALAARAHVGTALGTAGAMLPPIRAIRDEVEAVLVEAEQRWRTAVGAVAARRYAEARVALERLVDTAQDVPGPQGQSAADVLRDVDEWLATAGTALDAALQLAGPARELALLDVLARVADHEPTRAALVEVGVAPATEVRMDVTAGGSRVSWRASVSLGPVDYRVLRVAADGSRQPVGVTSATSLEDGGRAAAVAYAVVARRAGIAAPEARSDTSAAGLPPTEPSTASSSIPPPPVRRTVPPPPGSSDPPPRSSDPPPRSSDPPPAGSSSDPPPPARLSDPPSAGSPDPSPPARLSDPSDLPPAAVATLTISPFGRRLRLTFSPPPSGRAEVRRLAAGVAPPEPGSIIDNPDALGVLVPSMGPGLAVDPKPAAAISEYVVLTVGSSAVVGASAAYVDLPAARDLEVVDGRLRWTWPPGCTEVVVLHRADAAPTGPDDPEAVRRKVTNTRYEIDGGMALPEPALHLAVFACTRRGSRLLVATEAPTEARTVLP